MNIITEKSSPAALNAREELQHYLQLCADGISVDNIEVTAIELNISSDMEEEAWHLSSAGDRISIEGGSGRGLLYGVFHFLENKIGVHWWSPFAEYCPEKKKIELPALDECGKPFFLMREICRGEQFPDDKGKFAIRNRLNRSGFEEFDATWGGAFNFGSPAWVHTYQKYISPAEYGKSNPEFFALWNGQREATTHNQLCLSNRNLLEVVRDKMQSFIEADEIRAAENQEKPPLIYDFSINDSWQYCQCPECTEEIRAGGHSGQMLRFINELADWLAEFRPGLFICALAYYNTAEPPLDRTRARGNVMVRLCDTFTNCIASIQAPENEKYRRQVEEWSKVADNLIIWDYSINYREETIPLPYPSEYLYPEIHRFYADNHVKGIFWEHEYPDAADFYDYKVFLECKYLENPYRDDFEELRQTFFSQYFGPAAAQMLRYRELLHHDAAKHHPVMAGFGCVRSDFTYLEPETLVECHGLFEEAMAAAQGNIELEKRISRARLGLDCLAGFSLNEFYRNKSLPFHEMRRRVEKVWGETLQHLRHPEYSVRNIVKILDYHRSSAQVRYPEANDRKYRIVRVTKEMLGILSDKIEIADSDSEDLAVIYESGNNADSEIRLTGTAGTGFTLPIELSVHCLTMGEPVVKKQITNSDVTMGEYGDFELVFTPPQRGCVFYLGIDHTFEVRLDFLNVLEFDMFKEMTIRFRLKITERTLNVGGISILQKRDD